MTARAPSIRDVATAAGVSTATVSRTLSNPDVVSEATRAAVYRAIDETGYRVNVMARNLRRQETGAIAVLVPNIANPFFSRILAGIAEVMNAAGLNVLITDTTPLSREDHRFPEYFRHHQTDGLIVLDGNIPHDRLLNRGPPETRAPIVLACEWIDTVRRPTVTIDNQEAATKAVQHLLMLGHVKVGHLCGPPANVLTNTRLVGARGALHAVGLTMPDAYIYSGDFSLASGRAAAQRWLSTSDRPTAMFCASDEMAIGFVGELHRNGVKVPEDVSVIGFDDLEIAAHFIPPLTTIHQPRATIGRTAARMLLERMKLSPRDRADAKVPRVILPVDLAIRESTAPPPHR